METAHLFFASQYRTRIRSVKLEITKIIVVMMPKTVRQNITVTAEVDKAMFQDDKETKGLHQLQSVYERAKKQTLRTECRNKNTQV